jgi:hypothetical protein
MEGVVMEQQGLPISIVVLFLGVLIGALSLVGLIIAMVFMA